jgi:hypothetical protein
MKKKNVVESRRSRRVKEVVDNDRADDLGERGNK